MDQIDINKIGIIEKLREEVDRFKKFQKVLMGKSAKVTIQDIDIRNYAKYLLREGKDVEGRELLGCLKSKIFLKEKLIELS